MLGAFGLALRGIQIAYLGALGWMWGVELVLIRGIVGFVVIHNGKPCFVCCGWPLSMFVLIKTDLY